MVTLVDYGLGNIRAFENIYKRLNIPVRIAKTEAELSGATRLILPGVGAFDWAMQRLNESGMRACLDHLVTIEKRPVVGICVGMQMVANSSDEGQLDGLKWIDAKVRRFDKSTLCQQTCLPHMGWNDVTPQRSNCLFHSMEEPRFYFLHSYYFEPANEDSVLATTNYGGEFTSAVRLGNVFGVQFHPEKSHHWGIQLLRNFAEMDMDESGAAELAVKSAENGIN